MDKQELQKLLLAHRENRLTEDEADRLFSFIETQKGASLLEHIWDENFTIENNEALNTDLTDPLNSFNRKIKRAKNRQYVKQSFAAAAVLIVVLGVSFFMINNKDATNENRSTACIIKPGEDKAIITLEDGQEIDLNAHRGDTIYANTDFNIYVGDDGRVEYLFNKENKNILSRRLNKIKTPKGGAYQLALPDGSKVWLNSDSELIYPIQFDAESREVSLKGEAFFEIAHAYHNNKKVSFLVNTGDQQITVLGTSFNVNTYKDNFSTTLVTGEVMLKDNSSNEKIVLYPNQLATFDKSIGKFRVEKVDPYYSMAWKQGKFAFEGASIYDVMDQISRWYDIEVEYDEPFTDVFFSGSMSKTMAIKELLQIIEWTEAIKFEIKERRVIVKR